MQVQATTSVSTSGSRSLPILFCALLGIGIIFTTGHIQASALHDAAHDVRHATGFPCH
ncbi:CbtB domain-containing protein [Roseibium limicola]|uniref:CbtB-domain containing protein n=1 Tax=Roseibium limicola TaxID=2816037 RepID=A0A939ENW5_9HYPH|nr:CbtB domain-containing protein [Roseibium limicola]MBO0345256.1 CbtB-domain containing protein [Roseibium limicola]